ncbi:hypothetical protein AKJ63_01370 [candidate division MSBL1 archaeon SCGC-AAA259D18]|uniref:Uncharacterized protein n=1 Tax=candidate division MSBL1 archaeon SCGC-AAA259D18 TaxID=1698262 RepID=A0A133UBF7_9EURY|nr:hypothetical protein AKJ63_01370 [candidate division MSBL1 archaeon SCGC-AAA259D18]
MNVKTYASFEVLVELDTEDADEAEREALDWIGENAGGLTGENVGIIQVPTPSGTEPRVLKVGDRVTAPLRRRAGARDRRLALPPGQGRPRGVRPLRQWRTTGPGPGRAGAVRLIDCGFLFSQEEG